MDKTKAKLLEEVLRQLGVARATVEEIREEAQGEFDDKSDAWKESAVGEAFEDNLNEMSEVLNSIEDAETHLETLIKT